MEKIQTYSQKFTLFCAFAACFCFAHSNLMTITMVTWLSAWFIEIILHWNNVKFDTPDKNNIPLYLTLALFLWMVISLLWTENFHEAMRLFEMRIPLLIFPLFALFGMREEKKFRKLLLAFAVGTIIYSIIVPIQAYCTIGEQIKADPEHANDYFVTQFNDIKHRTQLGLLQLVSLYILHYLKPQIVKIFNDRTLPYHLLLCTCFGIVMLVLYISEGRAMLGTSILLMLLLTLKFLWRNNYKLVSIAFVPIILIGGFIIFKNHPRMQNDFSFRKEELQKFDPRYEQWRCAYHCIKADSHNMLIGEGIGDNTDVFDAMHDSPEFKEYYYEVHSAHNIWLDGQMEWGLVGNILLLCIYISNIVFFKTRQTNFTLYITIIWLVFSFFEPMFTRATPINLFCLFIIFSYWIKKEEVLNSLPQKSSQIQ